MITNVFKAEYIALDEDTSYCKYLEEEYGIFDTFLWLDDDGLFNRRLVPLTVLDYVQKHPEFNAEHPVLFIT